MKDPDSHMGTAAWAALGLGIAAYELWGRETLTHAAHRQLEHPRRKFLMVGAIGATALHLLDVLPHEYDIFYGFRGEEA